MKSAAEAFRPLRAVLDGAGVRFAIGGSWASAAFGEPRMTNDVDMVVDFTMESLNRFLDSLPKTFFVDPEDAREAFRFGRHFNVIYMPLAFKFDLFPASAYPLGFAELDRAVMVADSDLSEAAAPFV